MKNILLFVSAFLLSLTILTGQSSPDSQPDLSNPPDPEKAVENKEALKALMANYYEQLEFSARQREAANSIFEKYHQRYVANIGHYSSGKDKAEFLTGLFKDASSELKPHLDREQWTTIANLAARWNVKLEKWDE